MGYIVDLTVVLYDIFTSAAGDTKIKDCKKDCTESILQDFSRRHSQIHTDIRGFVAGTYELQKTQTEGDVFSKKVVDLIKQNCVPPSVNGPH